MKENLSNEESKPPSSIIDKLKKYFRNPFFIKTQSVSEVTDFLKDAVQHNVIDKEAESIATKAIKLGDITVKEIMIPKVDMVTIQVDENTTQIIEKIIDSGHSRYPVIGNERNEVAGILLAKDILPKLFKGSIDFNINDMLRDPKVVPETKKVDSLLDEFKQDRSHLAIVIDEYGEICGLITIEDILEELVGEIEDEHDIDEEEIVQIAANKYNVDSKIEIEEFISFFELKIDPLSIDAETLGGLFISKFGVLPKIGDKISIEGISIKVADTDKRRIKKFIVTKNK
ncbi:MAG: CBS domain-containing protein [SAR86 cluster bacterium]|uniref:Magnesium and cobalt efflux protein CorC n=1 Tax=SAR86 cluster bacterium TaxID=2030880 RepID=A0A520MYU0_9GAMM|nr:MAG: CBS domain-containing protein [SAR86 cluster bacterium]|tara:strand:- start:4176 stop:5033 length:858 start_codon:yes stop_codon:yes gene_type:complete